MFTPPYFPKVGAEQPATAGAGGWGRVPRPRRTVEVRPTGPTREQILLALLMAEEEDA